MNPGSNTEMPSGNNRPVITIDGANFDDVAGFYAEFGELVLNETVWGKNLDALADVLTGGMGAPEEGFVLIWKNSKKSERDLASLTRSGISYFEEIIEIIRGAHRQYASRRLNVDLILE